MITEWLLLITLVLAKPMVDETRSERVGDIIKSGFFGSAHDEETCLEGGTKLAEIFTKEGGGSMLVYASCMEAPIEVVQEIAKNEKWEKPKKK